MDVKPKINMNICHGCLSNDRNIAPLGSFAEIFQTLIMNQELALIYAIEDLKFCWECLAMLKRIISFRNQIKKAQNDLTKILYSWAPNMSSLSMLSKINKFYLDLEIKHESKTHEKDATNIKTEIFDDDPDYYDDAIEEKEPITNSKRKKSKNTNFAETIRKISSDTNIKEISINKFNDANIEDNFNNDTNIAAKSEVITNDLAYEVKIEPKLEKPKQQRPKDTSDVNNLVGYYRKYSKLINSGKKDWGNHGKVRSLFSQLFLNEKEMEKHFLIRDRCHISYERMPFQCLACKVGYLKKCDFQRHRDLNHHVLNKPYKCSLCSEVQLSAILLESHWRTHSVAYKCSLCGDFTKELSMRKHLDHAHTKLYECTVCQEKFTTLKRFTIHYKKTHMQFECDYCGKRLCSKNKIEKHIRDYHTKFWCTYCSKTYKNYINYKKHCTALHPDKLRADYNPELSFCVECNKQFPSEYIYNNHLRISPKHNKELPKHKVPCPECGKEFARKKNMRYHYNLYHLKETKYYCELCDKYFARPSGLRLHKNNVHLKVEKVKDKVCDLCGRAFTSNVILRNHRRTHTGERPYKCPHCSAKFIQKYAMKTHVRTQHKEANKDIDKKVTTSWSENGYFV